MGLKKVYCHSVIPIEIDDNVFGNKLLFGYDYIYHILCELRG